MKEERRVKRRKGEKGSVTLFVLISMMFILTIVIFSYTKQAEKINIQKRQIDQIQKQYETEDIEEVYKRIQDKNPKDTIKPTVTLSPNGGNAYVIPTTGSATIKTTLTAKDMGGKRIRCFAICMVNIEYCRTINMGRFCKWKFN